MIMMSRDAICFPGELHHSAVVGGGLQGPQQINIHKLIKQLTPITLTPLWILNSSNITYDCFESILTCPHFILRLTVKEGILFVFSFSSFERLMRIRSTLAQVFTQNHRLTN